MSTSVPSPTCEGDHRHSHPQGLGSGGGAGVGKGVQADVHVIVGGQVLLRAWSERHQVHARDVHALLFQLQYPHVRAVGNGNSQPQAKRLDCASAVCLNCLVMCARAEAA